LFIYYNARELDGAIDADEGTYLRSCIKVLKKYGTCAEATWPFDLERIFEPPHEQCLHRSHQLLDRRCLSGRHRSRRNAAVSGRWLSLHLWATSLLVVSKAGSKGLVPMPEPDKEQHDGGHAMLCVGYSDTDKVFIVRNSWGEGWGDRGYCYIPYDYMTNPDLNGDLWAIRHVADVDVDLSQDIQTEQASLFDSATAAIAHAIQTAGVGNLAEYSDDYTVEYTEQSVYVDGQYVALFDYDKVEALYYADYEEEYDDSEEDEAKLAMRRK
jgi:hypothetical protein